MTRFLADGRLEPDTNIVERPIRPIAIGRRNSLFAGDEGGGETWAVLSTLLNTAKLNGLDPENWLTDVLERIVSGSTLSDFRSTPRADLVGQSLGPQYDARRVGGRTQSDQAAHFAIADVVTALYRHCATDRSASRRLAKLRAGRRQRHA